MVDRIRYPIYHCIEIIVVFLTRSMNLRGVSIPLEKCANLALSD